MKTYFKKNINKETCPWHYLSLESNQVLLKSSVGDIVSCEYCDVMYTFENILSGHFVSGGSVTIKY